MPAATAAGGPAVQTERRSLAVVAVAVVAAAPVAAVVAVAAAVAVAAVDSCGLHTLTDDRQSRV